MDSPFAILPRFALRRPVSMVMVLAGLGVLGSIAWMRLPLELMPSGRTRATIHVSAEYRGAAPADLLDAVLEPAEKTLRTLPGLDSLRTRADFERGSVRLRFHRGTDMNEAYLAVREKLERLRPELPDDFKRFRIWKWSEGNWPIYWARLIIPEGGEASLPALLDELEAVLQRLPGVARVNIYGWADREVAVLVDPDALRRLRVDPQRVAASLRRDNFAMPLGDLMRGEQRIPVRALARFDEVDALHGLPLAPSTWDRSEENRTENLRNNRSEDTGRAASTRVGEGRASATQPQPAGNPGGIPGGGVRLSISDVARVTLRKQPQRNYTLVDGRPAVLLAVSKEDTANTVAVGRAVRETLENSLGGEQDFSRLEVRELFAEDLLIRDSLANLEWTALWGGLFALAVLWIFLRRWRTTALVMLAIPASLLINLIVMYFLGLSINLVSITGMMLALGMLVDNAVVVVENTSRHRAAGAPPAEAAIRGTGEVGLAILMGTLTTIIVFLPLPFLQKRAFMSFLFEHISWPIAISLTASLAVAVLFIPLGSRYLPGGEDAPPSRWLEWLRRAYLATLRQMLNRPLDAALIFALVLLTVWVPASNLKWNLFGSRSERRLRIEFRHDPVYGLQGVKDYFVGLSDRLNPRKEALDIETVMVRYTRDGGTLSLFLTPPKSGAKKRGITRGGLKRGGLKPPALNRRALMRRLNRVIGITPGVSHRLGRKSQDSDTVTLGLDLTGPDSQVLEELAPRVSGALEGVEGLGPFTFEETRASDHLVVRVNRPAARRYGVTAREVAQRVSAALRGLGNLPRLREGGEELDVVLQQDQDELEGMNLLSGLRMNRRGGGSLPLSAVTTLEVRSAPRRIERENGITSISLEARLEGEDLPAVERAVRERLQGVEFPPGYQWRLGDEVKQLREDRRSMVFSLLLALAAIFLVMGVLFESWLLPLAVLSTVPLAFFGSLWLLYVTGTALDTTGMIGIVILTGISVNNGIVLVDRINRKRLEAGGEDSPEDPSGHSPSDINSAILSAASERMRPILMTALTTIFGLLPMAFGYTNVAGFSFSALGRVVTGGLLAATLLTLFVVPLAYKGLIRLQEEAQSVLGTSGR